MEKTKKQGLIHRILFSVIFISFLFVLYLPSALSDDIDIDGNNYLKFSLVQSEVKNHNLVISNNGNFSSTYILETQNLDTFLFADKNKFTLLPREEKGVTISVFALKNQVPGVYNGKLIIKEINNLSAVNIVKVINYVIEVSSKNPFFEIDINLGEYKDGSLPVILNIKNINAPQPAFLGLELYIEDTDKNLITSKTEKITLKDSIELTEELKIDSSKLDELIVYVRIRYSGDAYIASSLFRDIEKGLPQKVDILEKIIRSRSPIVYTLLFLLVVGLLGLLITPSFALIKNRRFLNMGKRYKKGTGKTITKEKPLSKELYKEYNEVKELRKRLECIDKIKKMH